MTTEIATKNKAEQGRFLQIGPFKKHIRKTLPHKHKNYFEVVFLSKGKGIHTIDHQAYEVKPPVLFFVRKEQVHHWDLTTAPEGFVMILQKGFFDESHDNELRVLLSGISGHNCFYMDKQSPAEELLSLIYKEAYNKKQYQRQVLEGLLKAFFASVLSFPAVESQIKLPGAGLFDSFCELLNKSEMIRNQVSYYAGLLNTTPQNLNAVCRKQTGQAASEVIAGYIIGEAKRLLIYSSLSISEIAFTLDFKDPSHFVKYFRRYTGKTPLAYRKEQE